MCCKTIPNFPPMHRTTTAQTHEPLLLLSINYARLLYLITVFFTLTEVVGGCVCACVYIYISIFQAGSEDVELLFTLIPSVRKYT
jgi:hypothetical protein